MKKNFRIAINQPLTDLFQSVRVTMQLVYILPFILLVGLVSCSPSSDTTSGPTNSTFGKLSGHIAVDKDSLIQGATVTLLPIYQQTISGPAGAYSFDSVPPGTYSLLVQKTNLLFDTDRTQMTTVTAGQSTIDNPKLKSILGSWHILVDFGGGTTEGGGLLFNKDLSAGLAFDYTGYSYGSWNLQDNNVSITHSGRSYKGLLARINTSRYYWRATR
jgi:hypothetical protein